MKLDAKTIAGLAEHLESCQLQARDTVKITDEHPDMDWDDAYAIQAEILRRKRSRGLKLAGLKAGLTSHAKMKQMGVTTPVFGFMTDDYAVPDGGEVATTRPTSTSRRRVMPRVNTATRAMLTKVTACIQASNGVGAMFLTGTAARLRPITATTAPVTTGGISRSIQPVPLAITTKPISA